MKPRVVIIGAGPAGLTAALEMVRDGRMQPVVLEASQEIGGLSRTVDYKGYRMDIGGHRFFSKSDWVMNWWREILPIEEASEETEIAYQGKRRKVGAGGTANDSPAGRMLVRRRLSRIHFLGRYFDYPLRLDLPTLRKLGARRLLRIAAGYLRARAFPRRPERSLEDFLVNRFGTELYRTFFRDYTEKVWGVPCTQITAEWGAQRIKGVSVGAALRHAVARRLGRRQGARHTSLIEQFLYPERGPGQLWQEVARRVIAGGGELHRGQRVATLRHRAGRIMSVESVDAEGVSRTFPADHVISTMAVKDLVAGLDPQPPADIAAIAAALPYRSFITVGMLLSRMRPVADSQSRHADQRPPDNWIYVQDPGVRLGRIQVFNNWSPALVADDTRIWLGLEYFCDEGDDLWQLDDAAMQELAIGELERIGLASRDDLLDATVVRVPKTYPGYFGAYAGFPTLRAWLDGLSNLYLVGRNGMHRYNNQDHSMLTAKLAVEAILSGNGDKAAIWAVNIDDDYHEESSAS
jgi:protoporphyrinogen oxidase